MRKVSQLCGINMIKSSHKSFFKNNINIIFGLYSIICSLFLFIIFYNNLHLISLYIEVSIILFLFISSIIISIINIILWKRFLKKNIINKIGYYCSCFILLVYLIMILFILFFWMSPRQE